MPQQLSLKRDQFVNNIRLQQRQRRKRQIRQKFHQINTNYIQQNKYDQQLFKIYRYQSRSSNFNKQQLQTTFHYLFNTSCIQAFANELNLKFINDMLFKFHQQNSLSPWQIYLCENIKKKLDQLIKYQISNQPHSKNQHSHVTQQLNQLTILHRCFATLLILLQKYPCFHQLWHPLSHIKNQSLKRYAWKHFKNMLEIRMNNLTSQQITVIVYTIDCFTDECLPDEIITIIDALFTIYFVRPQDAIKLIQCLLDLLAEPHSRQKMQIIIQNTNLYENIILFLDKSQNSQYTNFDVVSAVASFVGKIFSVDDQDFCKKVYIKNIMILSYLRSWLPFPPNVTTPMLEHMGNRNLIHKNHKCTLQTLFALSNIIASDSDLAETALCKSDIYRVLIMMYKLLPEQCRQQIVFCLYNMVCKSGASTTRIMLETKLPQIMGQMLKQNNPIILLKCLNMIILISKQLQQDNKENNKWLYNNTRFKATLENIGAIKSIQSLLTFPQPKIVNTAEIVLNLLKD